MKVRRALVTGLLVGACFGVVVGGAVALIAGRARAPVELPPNVPAPSGTEPRIYIDAGAIELYDGSLTIHPPSPPEVHPR